MQENGPADMYMFLRRVRRHGMAHSLRENYFAEKGHPRTVAEQGATRC